MPDANEFMKKAATADGPTAPPGVSTEQPSVARVYGMFLGGKDYFEIDAQYVSAALSIYPESADIARDNRRFLYRAVRYLARDEGIDQFLDLGSGLPTLNNVHEVAQAFRPNARVVYVDNDPVVSAHGRALLSNDPGTAFVEADLADSETIRNDPATRELLDFARPVALLMFSIGHCITDDAAALRAVQTAMTSLPAGSFLALSHLISDDEVVREASSRFFAEKQIMVKIRSSSDVDAMVDGLETVEPGLVDINEWRPDPTEPQLPEPHPIIKPYLGASAEGKQGCEYGGVLRKP